MKKKSISLLLCICIAALCLCVVGFCIKITRDSKNGVSADASQMVTEDDSQKVEEKDDSASEKKSSDSEEDSLPEDTEDELAVPEAVEGEGEFSRFSFGSYWSASTGDYQKFMIYLPEGYEEGNASYPVLYMLHGVNGDGTIFAKEGIGETLDQGISDGVIDPLIVVFPYDPTGNSYWMQQYGPMVGDDLVYFIDATYRTLPDSGHRFIGGCSMGGGGAFHIFSLYPEKFGGVISFYGALNDTQADVKICALSDEQLEGKAFFMACGEEDIHNFFIDQGTMNEVLANRGVEQICEFAPGNHNADFYMPRLNKAINFVQYHGH